MVTMVYIVILITRKSTFGFNNSVMLVVFFNYKYNPFALIIWFYMLLHNERLIIMLNWPLQVGRLVDMFWSDGGGLPTDHFY